SHLTLSIHKVEHPSHARRSSLVELYKGLSNNQSKTSTSSVPSVYPTPQLSTPLTAIPLIQSLRLAQKDSISKKRPPHRQRTPVAESKKRQFKESRIDILSPSPLGPPNPSTDLKSPPAKAPCQPSRPHALDLTSIKAVHMSLQDPLKVEAEKDFSPKRLVSPPEKSENDYFFCSKGVSPGGSKKRSPHCVKEPVAESKKSQCPETRNDISSSSPLGPPNLTTDLKKQPAKPPSQQSSPCTPEITSVKRGELLYKLLGAALKEYFKSPAPFLYSSYAA
ncbi:hypothetical protein O181_038668, partial [Austropuccinia psidii MF-1]|nr:hypothetical protein [Austropuccinia psidii MF-1]